MPGHVAGLPGPLLQRIERLTPDQRAAATAEPGPILCVAPAGSGKTTTLIARICWLLGSKRAQAGEVTAVTFNKRAAEELRGRLQTALQEFADPTPKVRVRTFHGLAREILVDAGQRVEPLVEREEVLRAIRPGITRAEVGRLDTVISRLKLDLGVSAEQVVRDPDAGPTARTFIDYEHAIARSGGLDFDDLLVRALQLLDRDGQARDRWRRRCSQLLVDEAQDLDRSQLRLALLLAAPSNRIFLVGDDDQSIYGWRLADVRRLLGLAETSLPGLRRVDLVTNFRCPEPVVTRAVRLVEHNVERFAKTILSRDGATGRLVLARSNADDVDRISAVIRSWPDDGGTRAILARTNNELIPAAIAAVGRRAPFAAADLVLPVESPDVDEILDEAAARAGPLLWRIADGIPALGVPATTSPMRTRRSPMRQALLGWASAERSLETLREHVARTRDAIAELRRDDAQLTLATAHGTKGLEFDHVLVLGLEEGRFPSARSVSEAEHPARALEEERRLAYVAWTRARRTLTLLYDPGSPSQFLVEAFDRDELGVLPRAA